VVAEVEDESEMRKLEEENDSMDAKTEDSSIAKYVGKRKDEAGDSRCRYLKKSELQENLVVALVSETRCRRRHRYLCRYAPIYNLIRLRLSQSTRFCLFYSDKNQI
jgi:hypothetical protein